MNIRSCSLSKRFVSNLIVYDNGYQITQFLICRLYSTHKSDSRRKVVVFDSRYFRPLKQMDHGSWIESQTTHKPLVTYKRFTYLLTHLQYLVQEKVYGYNKMMYGISFPSEFLFHIPKTDVSELPGVATTMTNFYFICWE